MATPEERYGSVVESLLGDPGASPADWLPLAREAEGFVASGGRERL